MFANKGIRIRLDMKDSYSWLVLGTIFFIFLICTVLGGSLLENTFYPNVTVGPSVLAGLVLTALIIFCYYRFFYLKGKEMFVKQKHIQSLARMILNSQFYLTDNIESFELFSDKKKMKRKIVYFPRIYYKTKKNEIWVTIALDGSKFQKNFTDLGVTLEQMLACDLLETDIDKGFIVYKFLKDITKSRIMVDDVIVSYNRIPLMKGLLWDIVKTPHMLINGGTGGGKTVFIFTIIKSLLGIKADLTILDPKRSDLADLERCGLKTAYTFDGIDMNIRKFAEGMEKRYEEMRELPNYKSGESWDYYGLRPHFLIFDEFVAFMEMCNKTQKEKVNQHLTQIILKGRQAGYFIILATQRPDAQYLSGNLRDQLEARLTLGRMSDDGYRMTFGNVDKNFINKGQRGRGYIFLNGSTNGVREFLSPLMPKDYDFMKSISLLVGEECGARALEAPSGNGSEGAKPDNVLEIGKNEE